MCEITRPRDGTVAVSASCHLDHAGKDETQTGVWPVAEQMENGNMALRYWLIAAVGALSLGASTLVGATVPASAAPAGGGTKSLAAGTGDNAAVQQVHRRYYRHYPYYRYYRPDYWYYRPYYRHWHHRHHHWRHRHHHWW